MQLYIVAELVSLKADIIVTDGTATTRAAKNATKTIPIVMASDGDPIGSGFVASLARPGGNITGLTNRLADLSGKRLEVLKETIPGISRVGVIWNPETPASVIGFKETQIAEYAIWVALVCVTPGWNRLNSTTSSRAMITQSARLRPKLLMWGHS